MRLLKRGVFFLAVASLGLGLGSNLFGAQPSKKSLQEWMTDDNIRLYLEAVLQIRKQMMPPLQSVQIVRDTLKAYLRSLDPFSDYLSPEEYKQYKLFQQTHYAGVGMEIEQDQAGRIVCFPYPESPAMQAGIETGDILEAVDGGSTAGLSSFAVGMKIRGQEGTEVWLRVSKVHGRPKDIKIMRTSWEAKSVLVEPHGSLPIVRLLTFTNKTPQELQNAFATLLSAPTIVLDLRSNPGGSLFGAINSAKLFLAHGQKIVSLQTQEGVKEYLNDLSPVVPLAATLYLWQDGQTASAAEVFIAALSQNQRAVAIGKTSFGKGTVQDLITLSDGSALRLTTGYLQTPDGTVYHKDGLNPTYPLGLTPAKTADYLEKVAALMEQKSAASSTPVNAEKPATMAPLSTYNSQLLDIQIALHVPRSSAVSETLPLVTLLCFEKDFETDREAEIWSMEVRASLRERLAHYLLQRKKADEIKFVVCLGPFKNREDAEKERFTLSNAMQTPMFAEEVEKIATQE
jgi:carboxyl-terminal processing protease